jgi:hypothetical protein
LISKNYSPLKPLYQINQNLVGNHVSGSFGKAVSEEKIFFNQKKELPMAAMFVNGSELN